MSGEEEEEPKALSFSFGFVMLRTKRGLHILDRLGRWRATRPLSWFMLLLLPTGALLGLYLFLSVVSVIFSPQGQNFVSTVRTISPLANLGLPGINPYIPIVYGWAALVIAIVFHEAAHGIVARSLNLRVKSAGMLAFLVLPLGAFVELDDKQLKASKARDAGRVLAAGAGTNLIIGVACLLLLVLCVATMVPVTKGAAVVSVVQDSPQLHSPANIAGVLPGDFVTAIDNKPVTDLTVIRTDHSFSPGETVTLTIWRDGQTIQKNLTLGEIVVFDAATGANTTYPFLGVSSISYGSLQQLVQTYSNSLFTRGPLVYLCAPTFPACQSSVPFAGNLDTFYTSPLGGALGAVGNFLFWTWFLNFNLAIFNSLPIYPFDGGQAFEFGLRGLGRGRISDELARRITTLVSLMIAAIVLFVVAGPYLSELSLPGLSVG